MTILPTPSAAIPPRDGKQPGTGHTLPRSCQAASISRPAESGGFDGKPSIPSEDAGGAKMDERSSADPGRAPHGGSLDTQSSHAVTFPHPQAHPSQASAGNSASSGSSVPPLSIDPAFFAAWRETQYGPNDMEAR